MAMSDMGPMERMDRASNASEAFLFRWAYGSIAISAAITYGGNAALGWLYYGDPGYYYWKPGLSYTEQVARSWTEFGAPNAALFVLAALSLTAWTLYVLPSTEQIRALEGWMDADPEVEDGV